jgi:glutamine synthetase
MTLDDLRAAAENGEIDTVLVGLADMQGRLMGKRIHVEHFLDTVAGHGAEACSYLLAVDVEMNTVDGYPLSSWEGGYGDFSLIPDFGTLMNVPWQEGTAAVLCDLQWEDGTPVNPSPRQVLRGQIARLADRGWMANAGSELEFIVFEDSYEAAWDRRYQSMTPANRYNVDYSMLGTSRVEPLIRRIRNAMAAAGMRVEDCKGECNLGQHEIAFRYDEALVTCDRHVIFKNGAKEIAAEMGCSVTFMAKYDEREGSSCHLHISLAQRGDGENVFATDDAVFNQFLAGNLKYARELTLLFAPNINSYKRFAAASFAPTTIAWGADNRTCAFRVVGHGPGKRIECRIPGGDVNPYLAISALIASGLAGVEEQLQPGPAILGNAYEDTGHERVPSTLRDARELFAASVLARAAFGDEVVDHYLNNADVELAAFESAVTDWERVRGFERL